MKHISVLEPKPMRKIHDPKQSKKHTFFKVLAGIGLVVMALLGGVIILLSEPYPLALFGLLILTGAIWLAFQLFRPLFLTLLGLSVLVTVILVGSQFMVSTPPIVDAQGKTVPGSVASLEQVKLGGVDQWVTIRGKSTDKPVLLFLSGGPGGTELAWFRHQNAALEDHFVVVIWEQRGAGKSYAASSYSQITVDRLVEDGKELVTLLKNRFHQDKVYLIGHSWGTILGVKMAQRYPELFYAYVGTGQMVNTTENDIMTYQWAVEKARQQGDKGAEAALTQYGPPPYTDMFAALKYSSFLGKGLEYEDKEIGYPQELVEVGGTNYPKFLTDSPEFGLLDQLHSYRGLMEGLNEVYVKQLSNLDFESQVSKLEIPVYLMIGHHDYNSNWKLAERWFNELQAPTKELIWFENSGHSPLFYEPKKFNGLMVSKVLAETYLPKPAKR